MRPSTNFRSRGREAYFSPDFWPPILANHEELAPHISEVRGLGDRLEKASDEAHDLEVAVERAIQSDRAAFALAIRDEKPKPKSSESAARTKLEAKQREVSAIEEAASNAAADTFEAITAHGPALVQSLRDGELVERHRSLNEALEQVGSRYRELIETKRLVGWLCQDEARAWANAKFGRLPKPKLPRTSDDPDFDVVLAALRAAAEIEPKAKTSGFPRQPNAAPLPTVLR